MFKCENTAKRVAVRFFYDKIIPMSDWNGIWHNSRVLAYRTPFGAVTQGSAVRLHIDVPDPSIQVRLRLWIEERERIMEGERQGNGVTFNLQAPDACGLFWYYFILTGDGQTYCYGCSGGEGMLFDHGEPPSWQVTVYAPFETPQWFREGICYQIFPDRFASSGKYMESGAAYHTAMGRRIVLHEDWDEEVNYRPYGKEQFYEPCDFYGGDLYAIEQKLPYLKSLGVSCIYLNPVFESPSNHRYNTADYEHVDPMLGGDAALSSLAKAAAEQGIRLMLDGVFSHTGDDSVYFNKYGRYESLGAYQSAESPYFDWYAFTSFPENYASWWGFKTLPELREDQLSYMAFVKSIFARYAAMGITSWRLDVADELPDSFIAFLRNSLKALDSEGMLLGEVWEDASNKEAYGRRRAYVYGSELDGVMGYPFRDALVDFLLFRMDARGFVNRCGMLRENYPKPFYDAQMNLLGSHDTVRAMTALCGAPHRDALSKDAQAMYLPDEKALWRGRSRMVLAVMTQMAMPGVPCIYYGDEAGLMGMADPFCRRTYPWGYEDESLLMIYKRLTHARRTNGALTRGGCAMRAYGTEVFAILRADEAGSAVLLINRGENAQNVLVDIQDFTEGPDVAALRIDAVYRDVLTDARMHAKDGKLALVLRPLSGVLLISEP